MADITTACMLEVTQDCRGNSDHNDVEEKANRRICEVTSQYSAQIQHHRTEPSTSPRIKTLKDQIRSGSLTRIYSDEQLILRLVPMENSRIESYSSSIEEAYRRLDLTAYTVGWKCALPSERVAALAMLDEQYDQPDSDHLASDDDNAYKLGRIVLMGPTGCGKASIIMRTYGVQGYNSNHTGRSGGGFLSRPSPDAHEHYGEMAERYKQIFGQLGPTSGVSSPPVQTAKFSVR
jgi:hypothetical protein